MMNRRSLLLSGAGMLAATAVPRRSALAQAAQQSTLRFVPSANLTTLDPGFSGAYGLVRE